MPKANEFVELVVEQMRDVGRVRVRAMFGGFGIYRNDCIFAIVADDRLYLKGDSVSRPEFEVRGLRPFTYSSRGRSVAMSYFEAPPEVFEDPDAMREWAQKALQAAARSGTGGP